MMKPPVIAVIQARMGASRLPNKMMLWLHGWPVIKWVWHRVTMAQKVDNVVVAIPNTATDCILEDYLLSIQANVFRGSESDVLRRMLGAARQKNAGTFVRVCADNPLVSGSEIDRLIEFYTQNSYDYAYNHIPRGNSYPDGLGAEITSMNLLEQLDRQVTMPKQREHIFNYIWDNPEQFKIGTCDPLDESLAAPSLKLDIDTVEDYLALLSLNVHPDMTAHQIVTLALKGVHQKS